MGPVHACFLLATELQPFGNPRSETHIHRPSRQSRREEEHNFKQPLGSNLLLRKYFLPLDPSASE